MHTGTCVFASLLLVSCASGPPRPPADTGEPSVFRSGERRQDAVPSMLRERVRVDVASALPLVEETAPADELLQGALTVASDELFSYRAAYSLSAGDLVSGWSGERRAVSAPTQIGLQQVIQDVRLELPELAGAPLSVAFNTELGSRWQLSDTAEFRREGAQLDWSPGAAAVRVQWSGEPLSPGASTALGCGLESSIRLPAYGDTHRGQDLRLSGRSCIVAAQGVPAGGMEAQAIDLQYVWRVSTNRRLAMGLSVVEPRPGATDAEAETARGYELDFLGSRALGPVRAEASVAFRRPGSWHAGGLPVHHGEGDPHWAADATLTWQLSQAALSANVALGADPLWFAPELGQRRDRFGLALDLSRWIGALTDGPEPRLGMNWNWARLDAPEATAESSLQLDVALVF